MWKSTVVLGVTLAGCGVGSQLHHGTGDWVVQTHGWVVARLESSRPHLVPNPADRLVVRIGADERILYEARPDDLMLSTPIVSRDGSMLAIAKTEGPEIPTRQFLYTMATNGAALERVVELTTPALAPRGAESGLSAAWSHDNTQLIVHGLFPGERATPSGPYAPGELQRARPLRSINLQTRDVTDLGRHGRWIAGGKGSGSPITSQAWAPDNRRLVYANDDGELIVVDVVTKTEVAIGPGSDAAWSPDGRWIAARVEISNGEPRDADYVRIAAVPPYERTVVFAPRRAQRSISSWFTGVVSYRGPLLWSPDGRALILRRSRGEREATIAIDSWTGAMQDVSWSYRVFSIGGRP